MPLINSGIATNVSSPASPSTLSETLPTTQPAAPENVVLSTIQEASENLRKSNEPLLFQTEEKKEDDSKEDEGSEQSGGKKIIVNT